MADTQLADLFQQRYGDAPGTTGDDSPASEGVARILNRRTIRQFTEQPVSEALLAQLLACAQSAPTKSDLQQYGIVVVDDMDKRAQITDWIGTMPWIMKAARFLIFIGDIRRNRRLCLERGYVHTNDNLDSFFNATVDGALAMQSFILAAESAGLACVPVSYVRNHAARLAELLGLPDGVFPIAGLAVGYPEWEGKASMRLPQSVVVHRDQYDDSNMVEDVEQYGVRRHEREPIGPQKQRHTDRYGVADPCPWAEQIARQLSLPERDDFRAFIEAQGFSLK